RVHPLPALDARPVAHWRAMAARRPPRPPAPVVQLLATGPRGRQRGTELTRPRARRSRTFRLRLAAPLHPHGVRHEPRTHGEHVVVRGLEDETLVVVADYEVLAVVLVRVGHALEGCTVQLLDAGGRHADGGAAVGGHVG